MKIITVSLVVIYICVRDANKNYEKVPTSFITFKWWSKASIIPTPALDSTHNYLYDDNYMWTSMAALFTLLISYLYVCHEWYYNFLYHKQLWFMLKILSSTLHGLSVMDITIYALQNHKINIYDLVYKNWSNQFEQIYMKSLSYSVCAKLAALEWQYVYQDWQEKRWPRP